MKKKIAIMMVLGILLMPQVVSAEETSFTGGGATTVSYQVNKETCIDAPRTGDFDNSLSGYLFGFSVSGFIMFLLLYIRKKEKEELSA